MNSSINQGDVGEISVQVTDPPFGRPVGLQGMCPRSLAWVGIHSGLEYGPGAVAEHDYGWINNARIRGDWVACDFFPGATLRGPVYRIFILGVARRRGPERDHGGVCDYIDQAVAKGCHGQEMPREISAQQVVLRVEKQSSVRAADCGIAARQQIVTVAGVVIVLRMSPSEVWSALWRRAGMRPPGRLNMTIRSHERPVVA